MSVIVWTPITFAEPRDYTVQICELSLQTTFACSLEQVLGPQVGGLVEPDNTSPYAFMVVEE